MADAKSDSMKSCVGDGDDDGDDDMDGKVDCWADRVVGDGKDKCGTNADEVDN